MIESNVKIFSAVKENFARCMRNGADVRDDLARPRILSLTFSKTT